MRAAYLEQDAHDGPRNGAMLGYVFVDYFINLLSHVEPHYDLRRYIAKNQLVTLAADHEHPAALPALVTDPRSEHAQFCKVDAGRC